MPANLRHAILLSILLCVSLGLPALAKSKAESAADAIGKADAGWAAAAAAKDLNKSVDVCGPDAAILVPNAPAAVGKDGIRKWFQEVYSVPNFKLAWHATRTEAANSGDMGYSTGVYDLSYTDPSGKQVSDHGKYVTVWKKQPDGSWKVVRDIFNSDGSSGNP
jgi:ketosteroid isomerase-like protein